MLSLVFAAMLTGRQNTLPAGVIDPYQWADRQIPIHGKGAQGTEVVDAAVTEAMRKYGVVGCGVCVCKGDAVLYCKGFGYSESPSKPFRPSTATRCGSLAKPITSLCALLLMDMGALNLDEKVLPILASVGIVPQPIDDRVSQITVRELMDHTSGLPGGATYTSWRPNRNLIDELKLDRKPTSKDVVLDALNTSRLDSDPGAQYQYANANFVILARVIEARSKMRFNDFLTKVAMPRFGVPRNAIFVSKDQISPEDRARGRTEAAYYQTSQELYRSFLPRDAPVGQVFGEAYRGYSTECSDGAGGIAESAEGIAKILTNLRSKQCALSKQALAEILTPPEHYTYERGFNPKRSNYYSKGFVVRSGGSFPWLGHGGMTNHCGGVIGHKGAYQYAAVSNWNNSASPFVDSILDLAISNAISMIQLR